MANEPEHRMLFDLRGRRKRVIQVIYVMLAVIMAASLVVIGLPGGVNPFNDGNSSVNSDAAKTTIQRADNLQKKLKEQPNNTNIAKELIRARFAAGQSLYSTDSSTGQATITDEATTQLEMAAEAWTKYLKIANDNPDPEIAQLMAQVLFTLSQGSTVAQFQSNVKDATQAQQIVADSAVAQQKKNGVSASNQLATLAIYQLYAQDYEAAAKSRDKALAATDDKAEQNQIKQTFTATEKDAKRIGKLIDQAVAQAKKDGGKSLENPLGSLGSSTSVGGASSGSTTP